jgi:hypothetical protein
MNYFLPLQVGAPDCFIYLKYIFSFLLNTLKKVFPFFILNKVGLWFSPLIKFTSLSNNLFPFSTKKVTHIGPDVPKFNYDNTNHNKPDGAYLAGLFEGDGHIGLSKPIQNGLKIKNSSPYIAITFVNKDLPLINKLLELFGGRLRFKYKENAIV